MIAHVEGSSALNLVRRLVLGAAAGAVTGLVVGGIWGRILMAVLAGLNPEDHGTRTDDGFAMGQFTIGGTINLLTAAMVIGAFGGLIFLGLRGLRFGPAWFRTASIAVGATIVVGALLVHSDGVDFSRLEPLGLAVALTLSMPLLYALGVSWLGDRWLGSGPTVWQRVPVAVPWVARGLLTLLALVAAVDLTGTLTDIFDGNQFT
jgi:hypothetical protein